MKRRLRKWTVTRTGPNRVRPATPKEGMPSQHLFHWPATALMAAALLVLTPACSSTHIQSTRQPAGVGVPPFRNVTVAGVEQNPDVRQAFENDAVADMNERGVRASASYTRFSFDDLKGNKEQLRKKLLAAGAESVLFVRVTQKADFVEGPPPDLGSMDMGAVDESAYVAFSTPGGNIDTAFRLGARLYRVSDGAVIWSGVLNTVMKEGSDSLVFIRNTAKTIVERMAKDKIIP
jgi:hypothetical protein